MTEPARRLETLERLSARMLELARSGDWEAVAALEARYRRLLQALFSQPPAAAVPADCLRRLLEDNAAILALGQSELAHRLEGLERLRRGRQAHQAYSDF